MPMSPEKNVLSRKRSFWSSYLIGVREKLLEESRCALLEDKAAVATLGISQLVRALSIVLFGGITTALKVHNAKKGLMPNNDYPYKAVNRFFLKTYSNLRLDL